MTKEGNELVPVIQAEEPRFLLTKRGLYYRPGNQGYTGIKEQAGRYLETDARPESGVLAIHEDNAPDYSPACFDDVAREHLAGKLAKATSSTAELLEALRKAETAIARITEGAGGWVDGTTSKNDQCRHGRWMYEGCQACANAVLDPVLDDVIRPALAKFGGGQ